MTSARIARLIAPALLFALAGAAVCSPGNLDRPREVRWTKTVVDAKFRAEGAAAADVNRDGKRDILAGNFWYERPSWTPHEILPPQEFNAATGYSNCFLTFAVDADGDRWTDQVVVGFPGAKATWRRNPGKVGGHWAEYPVTESACNESPLFADLDGDGQPELITPFQEKQMAFYRPGANPKQGWEQHLIGEPGKPGCARFSHGLGAGDVDGDRKPDILVTEGYYKNPGTLEGGRRKAEGGSARTVPESWTFVPVKLGPACAQMHTHDFDGDGDMDVISSSAHQIGVWWWEQVRGGSSPEFRQHPIDTSFSQSHSLMTADLNADGQPDFVTGKRWWAHGPNGDVNPNDPAVLCWYEFRRNGGTVEWVRHPIDTDSGVGTQFTIADMNRDRRPDLVISNKKGVFYFQQGGQERGGDRVYGR